MKWNWQINLIVSIFFLLRYFFGGNQWWHLLGALVFAVISIGSFFENNKRNNESISNNEMCKFPRIDVCNIVNVENMILPIIEIKEKITKKGIKR